MYCYTQYSVWVLGTGGCSLSCGESDKMEASGGGNCSYHQPSPRPAHAAAKYDLSWAPGSAAWYEGLSSGQWRIRQPSGLSMGLQLHASLSNPARFYPAPLQTSTLSGKTDFFSSFSTL